MRTYHLPMVLLAVCLLQPWPAEALSIRFDNKVFVGDEREPVAQSTTIFHEDRTYDYLEKPTEIVVLDWRLQQFVILDATRRISARVSGRDVLGFTEQLRQRGSGQPDGLVKFLLAPAFQEHFEASTGTLKLEGEWMSYLVQTQTASSPEIVKLYRDFSDWYARLNPMLNPSARPPFARLMLDAALQEHGLLPREVVMTITMRKGLFPKRSQIRSEHRMIDSLGASDMDRIKQTHEFMIIFKPVSLEEYRK